MMRADQVGHASAQGRRQPGVERVDIAEEGEGKDAGEACSDDGKHTAGNAGPEGDDGYAEAHPEGFEPEPGDQRDGVEGAEEQVCFVPGATEPEAERGHACGGDRGVARQEQQNTSNPAATTTIGATAAAFTFPPANRA
jgi:hypothetical protein